MAKCPYLLYKDTGWFSWDYICTQTGAIVGTEKNNTKVDYLCNKDGSFEYENCPIYQSGK